MLPLYSLGMTLVNSSVEARRCSIACAAPPSRLAR